MKINFLKLDSRLLALLRRVGKLADEKGLTAYVVGGFVRDLILKRPNCDLDVVIEGDALALAKKMAMMLKAEVRLYKQFGTATLEFKNGLRLDLATARKEHYPYPGALPVVSPGTIQEDLFRRDFTINAMAARINHDPFGELVDFYGGLNDLRKKTVRILHDRSFLDDPTRILRAVRFEQRFHFVVEQKTLGFLLQALEHGAVTSVKANRYFESFRKVFEEAHPEKCLQRLGILKAFDFLEENYCPDWTLVQNVSENIQRLRKKEFYRDRDWSWIYFLTLVWNLGENRRQEIATEFNLTREERDAVLALKDVSGAASALAAPGLQPSQVYVILNPLPQAVIYFLRAQTSSRRVAGYLDEYLERSRNVRLRVNGEDLKKLGVASGPAIGKILRQILMKKIDGEIRSAAAELAEIKATASRVLDGHKN